MAGLFPVSERFWATSVNWTSARRAAQAKATGLKVSLRLDRKEARWRVRSSHYLRKYKSLANKAWVTPSPDAARDAARLIDSIAAEVQEVMDLEMGTAIFEVWRRWPVSSGLSRAKLNLGWRVVQGELIGRMESGAPYTTFIETAGLELPGETRPIRFMDRRAKQASLQIVDRLSRARTGAR